MANRWGMEKHGKTMETVTDFIFLGSKITADGNCSREIKTLTPWKKSYNKRRQCIKKQRHYFAKKDLSSQRGHGVVLGRNIPTSEVIDISPGNLDSTLSFIQPDISYDVLCIILQKDIKKVFFSLLDLL